MLNTIKNRHGLNMIVEVQQNPSPQGLVFVMHGLGGKRAAPHIQSFIKAFADKSFTVVSFDTTHSYNDSEGDYEDATTTGYYEDLEDVLAWASKQKWYQEPFVLVGHSLGSICVARYAELHPKNVAALAPISTVVSGKLSAEARDRFEPGSMQRWEKTGWEERPSASTPGLIKRLKWSHMQDRLKYDLMPDVQKLTMPVLMIVGDKDSSTPPDHQQILFDALPGPKEIHIIKDAPHSFREPKHLAEIEEIFKTWIESWQ